MRAVRVHELVGPSGLQVDEVPEPACGAGEVLVDVRAAGVNFPDVLLSHGKYQLKPDAPFVPGGEIAGVVSAVGAGVTSVARGDRVAATMVHGAFAERVAVPELSTVKLPDAVSFETGVGFAAGDIPRIPLNLVLLKGCQIVGVFWGAFAFKQPEKNRANGARLFAAVAAGKLRPRVDAALPFTQAREALERLERRDVRGKIVLVP